MKDTGEDYTDEQIQEWEKEDFGNLPDGFFLSQSEINELRKNKNYLTEYAKEKLRKLIEKQDKENTNK
jgi:hypothetical protein